MNKPNHRDSTEQAFMLFLACRGVEDRPVEIGEFLGRASASEDSVLSFPPLLQRLFNWHFYNNNGLIHDSAIPGKRTSEGRLSDLLTHVAEDLRKWEAKQDVAALKGLLGTTGRIMHHIQDMSTPAHVVPVYHDPVFPDHYESYCEGYAGKITADLVDDQVIVDDSRKVFLTREEISAAAAAYSHGSLRDSLEELYKSSAEKTLELLRRESVMLSCNGVPGRFPLESFWQPNDGTRRTGSDVFLLYTFAEGFGWFGPLGNNFGKTRFTIRQKGEGGSGESLYEDTEEEYLRIYRLLLKKMLIDSVVVLEIVAGVSSVFSDRRLAETAMMWN